MDPDSIAQLIDRGLTAGQTSTQIAEAIVALAEDPTWGKAMSHPTRAAILRLLRSGGPISPVHAAHQVGVTLGTAAYHFRTLERLGLIEISHTIPRRGALEHIYQLTTAHAPAA